MKAWFLKLATKRGALIRKASIGLVGVALIGLTAWATVDVRARAENERLVRSDVLRDLGRVANTLFLAEEERIDGLIARLRIELRAQGIWTEPGILDTLYAKEEGRDVEDGHRIQLLMRRALETTNDLIAFELMVAGHDGLSMYRFEREAGIDAPAPKDLSEAEGFAKALWYSDVVRGSVVSAGRRIERGELAFESDGDVEVPVHQVAIAVHKPGELIQGAILASIDLNGLGTRLEGAAAARTRVSIVTPDGRRLGISAATAEVDSRMASLAARVIRAAELPKVFEADGHLVYGLPMAHADGSRANLLVIVETKAPPTGFAAWLVTAWPVSLAVLALVSGLAVWALIRVGGPQPSVQAGSEFNVPGSGDSLETILTRIEIARESFVLRDWLADVRGCLERDAATRGLSLDMRCERSLPAELESDPAWLGGLLVAMGREALEATPSDRVVLEILEDAGNTLRFEVEAGGVELAPVYGMREVAGRIGGHFESGREGRVALVLQAALAGS